MTVRVYIEPSINPETGRQRLSSQGPLYDATFTGGVVLGSHQPFLDACRVLAGLGQTGPAEMWDHQRPYPRLKGLIEVAAGQTVTEGERPPRFRKWEPYRG